MSAGGPTELRKAILDLRPWHLDVQVTPEISTAISRADGSDKERITFISPREVWRRLIQSIYPDGLDGRTMLDCACNCGGYVFWTRELGAGECLGFDVREHWIKQARFLQEARREEGARFEVCDLYDLPTLEAGEFDITLFKGIFYHLPDPIGGLKLAADRTRELLILNTAMRADLSDGMLVAGRESARLEDAMSGIYGLNWYPTGPKVLEAILRWLGFPATRINFQKIREGPHSRIEILAARDESLFASFDAR